MALVLVGIGLFIAAVIAYVLQDLLALWFCVIFGFFCLSWGIKSIKSTKQNQAAAAPSFKPEPHKNEQTPIKVNDSPVPEFTNDSKKKDRKASYHRIVKVAGVTYGCIHPNGFCDRQDVIEKSKYTDKLILEEYQYKGAPAFLIINERLGADIGNVPAWAVDKIKKKSELYDLEGEFINIDFFDKNENRYSDDIDDDIYPEYVYFCRIRILGYKKQ